MESFIFYAPFITRTKLTLMLRLRINLNSLTLSYNALDILAMRIIQRDEEGGFISHWCTKFYEITPPLENKKKIFLTIEQLICL